MNTIDKYIGDVVTLVERNLMIDELLKLEDLLYKNSDINYDSFYSRLSPTMSQLFLSWSRDNKGISYDRDKIISIIRDFLHALRNYSIVELRVAYRLTQQELRDFQVKIMEFSQTFCLIDYIVEPGLIGGAIIAFQGKYKDYSIAAHIDSTYGSI